MVGFDLFLHLLVQFIIIKINKEKHRKLSCFWFYFHSLTFHQSCKKARRKSRKIFFLLPMTVKLHHKINFNSPASKILCFTECCRECQNCHALISSSGLFSSRNINMMTLCEHKKRYEMKLNDEKSFRKFFFLSFHLQHCVSKHCRLIALIFRRNQAVAICSSSGEASTHWRRCFDDTIWRNSTFSFYLSLDLAQPEKRKKIRAGECVRPLIKKKVQFRISIRKIGGCLTLVFVSPFSFPCTCNMFDFFRISWYLSMFHVHQRHQLKFNLCLSHLVKTFFFIFRLIDIWWSSKSFQFSWWECLTDLLHT